MLELLYKSKCCLAFVLICLLAACNAKSDNDDMEQTVMEVEAKFSRGEDISQDTTIFQAWRYFKLTDDAEMKTLSALYSGCVYWQQNNYDSAKKALDEAAALARSSEDIKLMEKVQTTISTLNGDSDQDENAITTFLRHRKLLVVVTVALVVLIGFLLFLYYRTTQKRAKQ